MNRILVVGPSWVGDMVMAQSLFKALKKNQSNCRITVLAPAWSEPILARMPEVSASVTMPIGHGRLALGQRWRLGRSLSGQFDQAIVLPGSYKSALVPMFAGIRRRTGFRGEQRYGLLNDLRQLDKKSLPYNVQRFVALGLAPEESAVPLDLIEQPALEINLDQRSELCRRFDLAFEMTTIALCPGAEFGPAKQWPAAHFAEVARHQLDQGRQILILGSEKDQSVAGQICQQATGCIDLAGKTTLGEVIDLMSLASHVITNDSGLLHVAAAVGCHVVAIYGSSSDAFTPPLTQTADRLYLELSCRPCYQRSCPLGHLDCLNKLDPSRVVESIETSNARKQTLN
ncbi:MAG: lipopolysaccharide heptosyltransferase II [Gammaproteobacteria bacterium]